MIVLDTSVLVGSFTGIKPTLGALHAAVEQGEAFLLPSIVLYEWLRGPRVEEEVVVQQELFPAQAAAPFGPSEATIAARLYKGVGRARGREIDLAIAAYAIARDAQLWTLNAEDFEDLPGLRLYLPA